MILDIILATSEDLKLIRYAWFFMYKLVTFVIIPLAIITLITGIILGLGTPWGLFKHWWVVYSLVLTILSVIILLIQFASIRQNAVTAMKESTTSSELKSLGNTLLHSVGGLVVLLLIMILNFYKPNGLTPYGWRKLQERKRKG